MYGHVTHVVYDTKLVKEVHWLAWLGVRLEESQKGGFMVHYNSESSLVVEVKSRQHIDPLLVDLKESVLSKSNGSFTQGEDWVLRYQDRLYVPDINDLTEQILE